MSNKCYFDKLEVQSFWLTLSGVPFWFIGSILWNPILVGAGMGLSVGGIAMRSTYRQIRKELKL